MKPKTKSITRKQALQKAGRYALFTAAASMALLSPRKAMATSGLQNLGWGTGPSGSDPGDQDSGNRPRRQPPKL